MCSQGMGGMRKGRPELKATTPKVFLHFYLPGLCLLKVNWTAGKFWLGPSHCRGTFALVTGFFWVHWIPVLAGLSCSFPWEEEGAQYFLQILLFVPLGKNSPLDKCVFMVMLWQWLRKLMELAHLPLTWDLWVFQYSSTEGGKPSLLPQPTGWKNNVLLLYR